MTRYKLAVLLVLAALPLQAKPRTARPGADALILKALAGPATGYAAVERVQVFLPGKKPKALKVNVTALPSGRVRREVLPLRKKAASLVEVRDPERPEAGLARLRSVYAISVSTGGVVAKRKTWKLELRLKSGVLRRAWWVDRDSGLLMKRETYRDDGTLRRRERIVKLELPAPAPASFKLAPVAGPWSPEGFAFAGGGGGTRRFTNGLESYEVAEAGGKLVVTGDLAEDDAARVLEAHGK
ncbi:MAG: hypothetical protein Q8T11_16770 [Elusimicrobiota bacterium]|nr:hypothetical protein [Elusimicrobiota bacterium]